MCLRIPRKRFSKGAGPFPDLAGLGRAAVASALTALREGSPGSHLTAVDATCGNGHDTLFLAEILASLPDIGARFSVLSFDVQAAALQAAGVLTGGLPDAVRRRIFWLLQSHDTLRESLERFSAEGMVSGASPGLAAAMYNLGFLPRSDKQVTTTPPTTLASLAQAAAVLLPGGLICIHAYGGHPGGARELAAVEAWCADLPFEVWAVARYAVCDKKRNPEALFLAWKRIASGQQGE